MFPICMALFKQHMKMNIWFKQGETGRWENTQESKGLLTLEVAEPWEEKNPKYSLIY